MRQEGQGMPGKARGDYGQEQVMLEDLGSPAESELPEGQ